MGYSMSWAAVRGSTPEQVRNALALLPTGTREEFPESETTAEGLPGGWYMVVSNRDRLRLTSDDVLARLSATGEVVACCVEEHVMFSSAARWANGRPVWSVQHDAQRGIEHLEASGDLPPRFTAVRDELRAKEAAAGGRKAEVDYIFDVPVVLAQEFAGYRHDEDIPGLAEDAFEVLAATAPAEPQKPASASWWRRLLGG